MTLRLVWAVMLEYSFFVSRQGEFQVEHCDLASLGSVRQFAARMLETESRVDILVNCAGVKDPGPSHSLTGDGFEFQLGVNYISPYLLTWLLLPVIKRAGPGARIVNVSCPHHRDVQVRSEIER